jgi:hypothetical protein
MDHGEPLIIIVAVTMACHQDLLRPLAVTSSSSLSMASLISDGVWATSGGNCSVRQCLEGWRRLRHDVWDFLHWPEVVLKRSL